MTIDSSNIVHVHDWLAKIREWLVNKVEKDVNILPGIDILLGKIQTAHADGNLDDHWSLEQRLNLMMETMQTQEERGRIYFRWGLLEALNGDNNHALEKFKKAKEGYLSQPLLLGLLLWATSLVEWLLPEVHNDAAVNLTRSEINLRTSVETYKSRLKDDPSWLRERHVDVDKILRSMLNENLIIPCPYKPDLSIIPKSNAEQKQEQPSSTNGLLLWQVCETVTTGSPGAVGFDLTPIGEVKIDQLLIDGKHYIPHRLVRGEPLQNIRSISDLVVVRIQGDSMDLSNLIDGDYVLLRKSQKAVSGDMVAVQIYQPPDSFATIKHYQVLSDGSIELRPNSKNPVHKPRLFQPDNEGTKIIGIAIVVLKPLE